MAKELNWRDGPVFATRWSDDATYMLYVDENGCSNMKNVVEAHRNNKTVKEGEQYFNICSTLISKDKHYDAAISLVDIKHKYWPEGRYSYNGIDKLVCFHSDEIRKMTGPFGKSQIDYDSFITDLNNAMANMDMMIFDCFINKEKFYQKYSDNCEQPYALGIKYILERVVSHLGKQDKVMIMCESIGKKEDRIVLETIKLLMARGTYYVGDKLFNKITGVYFNKKRNTDYSKSYIGLEIADLCAYPIYKYCRYNEKDRAFCLIEDKFHGFPVYMGKGLKRFP